MKRTIDMYRPHKNGFPYKLLKYLYKYGLSSGKDVQEAIGLNTWAKAKSVIFSDRASINFNNIVHQLKKKD